MTQLHPETARHLKGPLFTSGIVAWPGVTHLPTRIRSLSRPRSTAGPYGGRARAMITVASPQRVISVADK